MNRVDASTLGCTEEEYRKFVLSGARDAFLQQRRRAKMRGVAWEMTINQWWMVWHASGRWSKRGRCSHEYVMCRQRDEGPYPVANVYIDTAAHNNATRNCRSRALPTGVLSLSHGRYAARRTINGLNIHITGFESVDAATSAINAIALLDGVLVR